MLNVGAYAGLGALHDDDLSLFQSLFKQHIGLHLTVEKKALLVSRLARRLGELKVASFRDYYQIISASGQRATAELQYAIDLITTNETRFFREAAHFDYLRDHILPQFGQGRAVHVWSAACSSGEEAFSIAMVLDDVLGKAPWRVVGSDISQRMLHKARHALYPMTRCRHIPAAYLRRHCLRGQQEYEGQLLVERSLRERVSFGQLNLAALPQGLGPFDVIFLCNVLIYFDFSTRKDVVETVLRYLRPGGYLMVGLAESLHGLSTPMENVAPAIYCKPLR